MRKELITITKKGFSKIENEWKQIEEQQKNTSSFHTYEYAKCVCKEYSIFHGYRGTPEFYLIFEDTMLLMICPVSRHKNGEIFSFGYEMGVVQEDFIYPDRLTDKVIYECAKELVRQIGPIKFGFVSQDSRLYQIASRKGMICNEKTGSNVMITLPDTYEKYLNTLSKRMRQTIRTAQNRLETDNLRDELKIFYGNGMTKLEYLKFSIIYANSVKKRYDIYNRTLVGAILHWIFAVFFQHNVLALNNVKSSFCVVYSINNKPVAVMGGYMDKLRHRVVVHRTGFKERYNKYSPGILMFQKQ